MILLECAPPFQWRPTYTRFGNFRRVMWGWFAATHFDAGGINELIHGIGAAAVSLHEEDKKMEAV